MKNYNTVYNSSREEVLAEKAALYESQKVAIVKALKENYMITKQMSELPAEEQKEFAKKLLEYWSPKTGINKAGIRLLNENELSLSTESTKEDIRLYIEKTTKKHLQAITEAYRRNDVQSVTNAFKEDIEPKIQKSLKESFINNTIWSIVSNRIKMGLD